MIEELQDKEKCWHDYSLLRKEPLLEYVWEVALEFASMPIHVMEDSAYSLAPSIFADRYAEIKLTDEERYARYKKKFNCNESFEEFTKDKYYKLDTSFKDRFLNNRELQNTIEAFGLDVSKFWYLLLFVYDYIEDFSTNAPTPQNDTLDEFNSFISKLEETTEIVLKKNGRKSYKTDREDIINLIKAAFEHHHNTFHQIWEDTTVPLLERLEKLNKLGFGFLTCQTIPIDYDDKRTLDISHKKWYFAKMFLFFLKNRKAKTLPHIKEKVSKDKMMFVSRLIYTVGYHGEEYKEEHDDEGNKNRMLSNLLRKYAKEEFPTVVHKYYQS